MASKLGVYWSVMHRRPQDYAYFRELNPTVFKIMDGGDNDYAWAKANLPGALVVARDWAMSEQKQDCLKDPIGTGQRHAREWSHHQGRLGFDKASTLIQGINEPPVWEAGWPEALRMYTIAMCDEATKLGLRVGAMQLSVGWPANTGPNTPPDWSPYHGVDVAIRKNNGALVVHEYWADQGPKENWGWWCGRSLKCPWQVNIIIGETGIDMYVKDGGVPHAQRGWRGRKEPHAYASELAEYTSLMSADRRFIGSCVFASDFASHEWYSFDIEPAYSAILNTTIPDVPTRPDLPPTTPEPAPDPGLGKLLWPLHGRVTQSFGQVVAGLKSFGEPGHNGIDIGVPMETPVVAIADGEVIWADFDKDYGFYCRIWHPSIHSHSFVAHLEEVLVGGNDRVKQGEVVAHSGNSGNSTGPHLHFELRAGTKTGYHNVTYGYGKGRYNPEVAYAITGSQLSPEQGRMEG